MRCTKCGYNTSDNDTYCLVCGQKLNTIQTSNTSQNNINIPNNNKKSKVNKVGLSICIFILTFAIAGIIDIGISFISPKKEIKATENDIYIGEYLLNIPKNYSYFRDEDGYINLKTTNHTLIITTINTTNEEILKKKDNIINQFKNEGGTVKNFKTQVLNNIEFVTYNATLNNITYGYMYGKIKNDIEIYIHIRPEIKMDGTRYEFDEAWFKDASDFISTAK